MKSNPRPGLHYDISISISITVRREDAEKHKNKQKRESTSVNKSISINFVRHLVLLYGEAESSPVVSRPLKVAGVNWERLMK